MPGNATDSPSPSADYPAGTMLGERYRLERKVGTGGMAQVWEASDLVLDRRVAVKILHPHLATDTSVTRFRREAIAAARLAHPNVVSIFDTISADGVEAIVMELVDGTTLRRHLDRHERLSPDDALHIGTSVCDALAAAHGSHLVHRDIKPANILLCRDGRVKIADFGIAKAAVGDGLTRFHRLDLGLAQEVEPHVDGGEEVRGRRGLGAVHTSMVRLVKPLTHPVHHVVVFGSPDGHPAGHACAGRGQCGGDRSAGDLCAGDLSAGVRRGGLRRGHRSSVAAAYDSSAVSA